MFYSDRLSFNSRKITREATAAEDDYRSCEKELASAQYSLDQYMKTVDQITDQIAAHRRKITKVAFSLRKFEKKSQKLLFYQKSLEEIMTLQVIMTL